MEEWELYQIFPVFSKNELSKGITRNYLEQGIDKSEIKDLIEELEELIKD